MRRKALFNNQYIKQLLFNMYQSSDASLGGQSGPQGTRINQSKAGVVITHQLYANAYDVYVL